MVSALLAIIVVVGLAIRIYPLATPTLAASNQCRNETFYLANNQAGGLFTVQNCSRSSVAAINNVLSNTDAAYFTFHQPGVANMRSTDMYVANNHFIAWIDYTSAPGIIRGLWGFNGNNGTPYPSKEWRYTTTGGGGLKSMLQIQMGFDRANPPFGYGGLHVEIWRELGKSFYSYRNSGVRPTVTTNQGSATLSTSTQLVNGSLSTVYTDPVNNQERRLKFTITYTTTPDSFTISTALGGTDKAGNSAPTNVKGHAGGLLLITNRACYTYTNCTSSMSLNDIRLHSLNMVKVIPDVNVAKGPSFNQSCYVNQDGYYYLHYCDTYRSTDDEYIAQYSESNYSTEWQMGPMDKSFFLSVKPSWSGGKNNLYGRIIADHYNDGRLGITGFGSVDTVVAPSNNAGGILVLDDTAEGNIRWNVTLKTLQTPAPTATSIPTPTAPNVPTPTTNPCPLKQTGDANCDGAINLNDFERFRQEYTGILASKTSDFNIDGKITLMDFEIWRRNFK